MGASIRVNANTNVRKSSPWVLTHTIEVGALLVVGAAPFMAKGTAGVESAGRAKKLPLQDPRHCGLGHMGRQGSGVKSTRQTGGQQLFLWPLMVMSVKVDPSIER